MNVRNLAKQEMRDIVVEETNMELKNIKIKKIDHLGIVAGVIKDLGITTLIDSLVGVEAKEVVTTGETVAAMIINGLGFASMPLSLTPKFFEEKALECLIRKGIEPKHLNRFKLGRSLDKISDYGCEKFFSSVALMACRKENVDMRFMHSDTTTFSLEGEYEEDIDSQPIKVTYGYSKDKRPDLKQVVQELMCSQDGGIPILSKTWGGNESDSVILKERVRTFLKTLKNDDSLRCLVADSKLYDKKNSFYLKKINFVTRIPSTVKVENECVDKAINEKGKWEKIDDKTKLKELAINHYGIKQRWIIVYSQSAHNRAVKSVTKSVNKEAEKAKKDLEKLKKQRFACREDAGAALKKTLKNLRYHRIQDFNFSEYKSYTKPGKPTKKHEVIKYQVEAAIAPEQQIINKKIDQRSCFVVGTNLPENEFSAKKVVDTYKKQDFVEKGFAFLKSPTFFVSSLFVKNLSRIQGLLVIMALALLVYSIAQRRLRAKLEHYKKTVPNQIKQPTQRPTMKWIFQCFEGIYLLAVTVEGIVKKSIEGINALRIDIIKFLGSSVCEVYGLN